MATRTRLLTGLVLALLLLSACTRRPETPASIDVNDLPPTATVDAAAPSEPDAEAVPTLTPVVEAPAEGEPATEGDAAEGVADEEPLPLRPDRTFQYTVQEGDNISFLAEKFGTTMQVLRELNFLTDDNIQAGAILIVPYVEGITEEGVPTPLPGPFEYTVQPGDTLGAIEARFNINQLEIIEANQLLTPDSLIVGTTLIIPGYIPDADGSSASAAGTGTNAVPGAQVTYIVQPGDSFFSIAQEFGIDPDDLAIANNIVNRNVLRVGQELIIPGVSQRDVQILRGTTHTVASGETLSEIATQYGVTVESILSLNNLTDPNSIVVGQELVIPGE